MPRVANTAKQLADTISKLQTERRAHMAAVERIDALFGQFGINPANGRRPGRPAGGTAPSAVRRRKGTRRSFPKSGLVSIYDFVKSKGSRGATTSEINKHWRGEGRAGSAYVTIGHLVKAGKLKKEDLKGERGSRYSV